MARRVLELLPEAAAPVLSEVRQQLILWESSEDQPKKKRSKKDSASSSSNLWDSERLPSLQKQSQWFQVLHLAAECGWNFDPILSLLCSLILHEDAQIRCEMINLLCEMLVQRGSTPPDLTALARRHPDCVQHVLDRLIDASTQVRQRLLHHFGQIYVALARDPSFESSIELATSQIFSFGRQKWFSAHFFGLQQSISLR